MAETIVGDLVARLRADTSQFSAGLGGAERDARGFGTRLSKIGDMAAGVFGGVMLDRAAMAFGSFMKGAFDEATEAIKIGKETERVIVSMGGAANVTVGHVEKLSEAISKRTGIDDEAIQSGANLLLTFGNIRNEVGKGNKVFDQATRLSQDMATVMKTDMRTAALQVGKALNDPIAGLTALRRVGVQFTDQQEEQIKAMVEAGDAMGAQKVILGELKREFGGAAAAAATPFEKLQVQFKNMQEELGMKMMPVLVRLSEWFLREGIPAIEGFVAWFKANWPEIQKGFQDAWVVIEPILTNLWDRIKSTWAVIEEFVGLVKAIIDGDWSEAWERLKALAGAALDWVWDTALALPAKLAAALWDAGVAAAKALFDAWVENIDDMLVWLVGLPQRMVEAIGDIAGRMWDIGVQAGAALWNGIKSQIGNVLELIPVIGGSFGASKITNPADLPDWYDGPRAAGGPVSRGMGYTVGENGPELFVPGASGSIIPNHALGGGGTSIVVNVSGFVGNEAQLADEIHAALLSKQSRSGGLGFS